MDFRHTQLYFCPLCRKPAVGSMAWQTPRKYYQIFHLAAGRCNGDSPTPIRHGFIYAFTKNLPGAEGQPMPAMLKGPWEWYWLAGPTCLAKDKTRAPYGITEAYRYGVVISMDQLPPQELERCGIEWLNDPDGFDVGHALTELENLMRDNKTEITPGDWQKTRALFQQINRWVSAGKGLPYTWDDNHNRYLIKQKER